jgi:uncharacterized protein YlzI (FlbEa/FlbD family)
VKAKVSPHLGLRPGGREMFMPLIKLNRINKGGEIVVNSDYILFIEIESRTTTLHMAHGLLFSVVEPIDEITRLIDAKASEPIATGIQQSGLTSKN